MPSRIRPVRTLLVLPIVAAAYFVLPNISQHTALPESAYAQHASSETVTWRNCKPISVILGKKNMDPEKNRLVRDSLKTIASATGLSFNIIGTTDEIPQINWSIVGPKSPYTQYPPVYIGWLNNEETDILATDDILGTLGAAVANPITTNSHRQLVSGAVIFDNSLYQSLSASNASGETRRNLVLHELGHLVGLGHVGSPGIMHSNPAIWPSGLTARDLKTFGELPTNC